MTLARRLIRDLKANGPKTAVLGVLLLVGLYFWIPPLWQAIGGSRAAPVIATAASPAEPRPAAALPGLPYVAHTLAWQEAERLRSRDKLLRPPGTTEVRGGAFRFDPDCLPIDVEFAEVPDELFAIWDKAAAPTAAPPPPKLALQSTLVGAGRRSAVVNGRVYTEGAEISTNGMTWILRRVEPRRAFIEGSGITVELKIDPFGMAQAGQ